jgi:hypothetical protein
MMGNTDMMKSTIKWPYRGASTAKGLMTPGLLKPKSVFTSHAFDVNQMLNKSVKPY